MGFMTQVGFAPCFEGYNPSAVKKGQEESSYLSEKQLQEAIKAQKCIQQKQFLVPLSLWQSTCFHLHREIDRKREGARGLQSLRCHSFPFSLLAISHYNTALFTFYRCGLKIVKQREAIWTN